MNKKISIGVCVSLIAIACTVAFVITWSVSLNIYNDKIKGMSARDTISVKLQEIDSFVRNNSFSPVVDDVISSGIFSGYMTGVGKANFGSAGDKNAAYFPADEYTKQLNLERGRFVTCGVRAEKDEQGYLRVAEVYPGSSAESMAVAVGDTITAIDAVDVLTEGADVAVRFLEGEENTRVSITALRNGEESRYSLVRQMVEIVSVESAVVDGVGFIRVKTFNDLTAAQFETALSYFSPDAAEVPVRALFIDLRNNASGFYSSVQDIVNRLVSSDGLPESLEGSTVVYSEHAGGVRKNLIMIDDSAVDIGSVPVIMLTDKTTSGAGELMAATVRTYSRAGIVGMPSAGNNLIPDTHKLNDGSAVRVTVGRVVMADGSSYADTGVTPDNIVELSEEEAKAVQYDLASLTRENADLQIQKAFEVIETITSREE